SSRRRHTRSYGDWSSDVCSSDLLVRDRHLPEREIMTGIGPVAVRCPRVRDRGGEGPERTRFSSAILPPARGCAGSCPDPERNSFDHILGDGRLSDRKAELEQLTMNVRGTPKQV